MKTVIIGDVHGRSLWKLAINQENPDRVVFVGDYFDSYDIKTEEQVNNFLDIIEYKKTSGREVIMLIGNHDHHYFPEVGYTGTSGYQTIGKLLIEPTIDANREHLQMAYQFDDILCTHAGVSETFMDKAFGKNEWSIDNIATDLNELFKYKPLAFTFASFINEYEYSDPYGDDIRQSPIWVRPKSLQKDGVDKKKLIQVVGHTQQSQIDIKGKATGGRYYFIDVLGTSGEYLTVENGKIKINTIR
jgi:hypothetical protein